MVRGSGLWLLVEVSIGWWWSVEVSSGGQLGLAGSLTDQAVPVAVQIRPFPLIRTDFNKSEQPSVAMEGGGGGKCPQTPPQTFLLHSQRGGRSPW